MTEERRCSDKYKKYSPLYMLSYGKIDIWELFCPDWRYFDQVQMTFRDFVKSMHVRRKNVRKEGDGLFAFLYSRNKEYGWGKYHSQFFYQLCESCDNKSVITLDEERHWSAYALLCLVLLPFWYQKCRRAGFDKSKSLALTLALYDVKNDVHEFLKVIGDNIVVTYCDVFASDHYLTKKLNKRNYVTVTVQHGIYTNDDYDFVYSESKYFVANCKLSKKYAMECGKKLVYSPGLIASISEMPRKAMIKNGQFLVLVDGFDANDQKTISTSKYILEMAERFAMEYGYKYVVRYHPMNAGAVLHDANSKNIVRISESDECTMDVINEAEFIIMGRSTAWFQAISLLCPTFRYMGFEDDYMSDIHYNGFMNYEELKELYRKTSTETIDDLKLVKQEYLGADDVLAAYQNVWRDITQKEGKDECR